MENTSDKSEKPSEMVTLILQTKRFEVEKQKLIKKSQYFAALLSENYVECHQTEHIINYDISPILLQDFIDWIHNDKLHTSATNCDLEELDHLLLLLELSVLFAADNLVEDITHRLVTNMSPKYSLSIWLLAQQLNINTLRDLSLDVCLDCFNELPLSSVYELSRQNFIKLIGSLNVRATKSYLCHVIREWNYHNDFSVCVRNICSKEPKILNSIISCENPDGINNKHFIHCWDGRHFFELTSFEYPKDITEHSTGKNMLVGTQITGRRYDLYLCGGEFGTGSGMFNTNVWRYSLISKKWYLQTVMPVERRHMIAIILKDKLLLVGGRGRNRKKLQSVDIYDICTGTWTSGAIIPRKFSSVPEHSITNEKLIVHGRTCIFVYCLDEDVWERFDVYEKLHKSSYFPHDMPLLTLKTMSCYIDVVNPDEIVLRVLTEACNKKYCNCLIIERNMPIMDHITLPTIYSVMFMRRYAEVCILTIQQLCGKYPGLLVCMDYNSRITTLHLHSIPIQNPNMFRSFLSNHLPRKFCNLYDPEYFHL